MNHLHPTKRDRKRAAKALRKAVKIMNKGGQHWTREAFQSLLPEALQEARVKAQRRWQLADRNVSDLWTLQRQCRKEAEKDPRNCQYCAVGGLRVAFGINAVSGHPPVEKAKAYRAALRALVTAAYPHRKRDMDGILLDACSIGALESLVIEWNDRASRRWGQVDAVFNGAADALESEVA